MGNTLPQSALKISILLKFINIHIHFNLWETQYDNK